MTTPQDEIVSIIEKIMPEIRNCPNPKECTSCEKVITAALSKYGKAQFEAGKKAGMLESFQKGFEAGEEIGFEAGQKKADELIEAIHLYNTDSGYALKQAQIITRKQVMDDMKAGRCPMRCTEWNYAGSCEHLNHA
jgi:flagellar biosynthesis/type III secretory pathway protein FliH